MKKPTVKAARARVSRLYAVHCNGIQVPIMALGSIMEAGLAVALLPASTDDEIGAALLAAARKVSA